MNDRYLFRGKVDFQGETDKDICDEIRDSIKNYIQKNDWVIGALADYDVIVGDLMDCNEDGVSFEFWQPIRRETIGQCTGLKDKNGTLIFEGDIVKYNDYFYNFDKKQNHIGIIEWQNNAACFRCIRRIIDGKPVKQEYGLSALQYQKSEIIGNIHDNPELLEVQK